MRWGDFVGVRENQREVDKVYQQITTSQKNILDFPLNATVSKEVIAEVTCLIKLNTKTTMEPVVFPSLVIFLPLMLQKPLTKSKNKDYIRYMKERIKLWKEGNQRTAL